MKKVLSIITVMSLAVMTMFSAVSAAAEKKLTAEKVKALICSTGLTAHPEVWDKTITEIGKEEDVLNPETRKVTDVINTEESYRTFFINKSGDKYIINENDDTALVFTGFNEDGIRVRVSVFPENYDIKEIAGSVEYEVSNHKELNDNIRLIENYNRIAEIINESGISEVTDINIASFDFGFSVVYLKDNKNNEYAIPTSSYTDNHAKNLGREVKSVTQEHIMPLNEWCSTVEEFEQNMMDDYSNEAEYEEINGDEIRDTDTRAAYIGTESRFVDVSGDLVSYVNELNDLGIINGYDDGLFLPDNTITRAEAAAMLARMLKYTGSYNGEFADINAEDWFANDVAALAAAGVINGYDENTFAPSADIKYQEIMKILVFTLGYATKYDTIFDNFYPSMTNQKAMEIGLTNGLNSFDTTTPITRGDMAIMLSNALDTHMFTEVKVVSHGGTTGGVSQRDITLIDYLNGKKLNGTIPKAYFD